MKNGTRMSTATLQTMTDETAFVVTDAGLDALRLADAEGTPVFDTREAADAVSDPCAAAEARWTIDSADKADWYLRKVRQAQDEIATVKAQAAAMVRALESDLNRLNARHEADFLAFAKAELARRDDGRKTLPLFQGTVSFRTVPSSLRVCGSREAIEYARTQGVGRGEDRGEPGRGRLQARSRRVAGEHRGSPARHRGRPRAGEREHQVRQARRCRVGTAARRWPSYR